MKRQVPRAIAIRSFAMVVALGVPGASTGTPKCRMLSVSQESLTFIAS